MMIYDVALHQTSLYVVQSWKEQITPRVDVSLYKLVKDFHTLLVKNYRMHV